MGAKEEIKANERFEFGENWAKFLEQMDDERIAASMLALKSMLASTSLAGKRFLDIGSGSGLSSLAARKLGAKVYSFDYDPQSVACTRELKRRYFVDDDDWTIAEGSVLDKEYLTSLGQFDIVYSWGVLHHTGAMWEALANVDALLSYGGQLFIAIYNDQGGTSGRWHKIKQSYTKGGKLKKALLLALVSGYFNSRRLASGLLRHCDPFYEWKQKESRGMDLRRDMVDWVGGYPFEVARPEQVFDFYYQKGYTLTRLYTAGGGHACNQFVFEKKV